MKIAIYGQGGFIGSEIEKNFLRRNQKVNILSRRPGTDVFGLQEFSKNSFNNYDSVIFLAHDYDLKAKTFKDVLIEIELNLQRDETKFLYLSTLSAHDGNRSRYSRQKLILEDLFLKYGHVVLRSGIIIEAESSTKLRAKFQLLVFFKYLPFRLTDKKARAEYFLTDLKYLSQIIIDVIIHRKHQNGNIYTVGPIGIESLLALLGGKVYLWKMPLNLSAFKKFLQSLAPLLGESRIFDKVLNLISGMSNSSPNNAYVKGNRE